MLVTSCFLGRRIGYFRLQFRKEFFNLPPTRRIPLISRKTSNLKMLLDLGIMLLPFDFKISVSLPNDVSWTICTILASTSLSSFTVKTLLLTVSQSTLFFNCLTKCYRKCHDSFQFVPVCCFINPR